MARTIGVMAVKGGVGKTTIAAALAADLANHYKQKVLLVDGNHTTPHIGTHMNVGLPTRTLQDVLAGKASTLAAVHKRYGVDVIPGDLIYPRACNPARLKNAISKISSNYDFVVIDSAPTMGDEAKAVLAASDGVFLVTTPDEPTLQASLAAARMISKQGTHAHGIVINKARDRFFQLDAADIEKATGIPVVACLPDDKNVNRALFTQIPVPVYDRKTAFSRDISKLSAALSGVKEEQGFLAKVLGLNKQAQAVNREVLRNEFYTSIFGK